MAIYDKAKMISERTAQLEETIARRKANGQADHPLTLNLVKCLGTVEEYVDVQIADMKRQDAEDLLRVGQ